MREALGWPEGGEATVMAIHTFGECLDFHPHLLALVVEGLFGPGGQFRPLPEAPPRPLEETIRVRLVRLPIHDGLGEQGYFLTFPSKFISADGRTMWLGHSANFAAAHMGLPGRILRNRPETLLLEDSRFAPPVFWSTTPLERGAERPAPSPPVSKAPSSLRGS